MSYFPLKNGEKLYYEDIGQGRSPVIMLHGWTGDHGIFSQSVQFLQEKTRCILYDQRGHGQSDAVSAATLTIDTLADDLHELVMGLGISNVTLVGWSMGASVAFAYIKKYDCHKLKQLVICDMTPKPLNDEEWHLGFWQENGVTNHRRKDDWKAFSSLYIALSVGRISKLQRMLHTVRFHAKRSKSNEKSVMKHLYDSMKQQDYRDVIEAITVPFAYFYAEPGSLVSPELALWYRVHIRSVFQATAFVNSTHMLIAEQPTKFAQELEKLL